MKRSILAIMASFSLVATSIIFVLAPTGCGFVAPSTVSVQVAVPGASASRAMEEMMVGRGLSNYDSSSIDCIFVNIISGSVDPAASTQAVPCWSPSKEISDFNPRSSSTTLIQLDVAPGPSQTIQVLGFQSSASGVACQGQVAAQATAPTLYEYGSATADIFSGSTIDINPSTGTLVPLQLGCSNTTTTVSGKYFVWDDQNSTSTNKPEVYDASTGQWTTTPLPPAFSTATSPNLCSAGVTMLGDGTILVTGGGIDGSCINGTHPSQPGNVVNASYIFDPGSFSWVTASSAMKVDRDQFGMVTLPDGSAFAVGGCAGGCTGPSYNFFVFSSSFSSFSNYPSGPYSGNSAEIYQSGSWVSVPTLITPRASTPATLVHSTGNVLVCGGGNGMVATYNSCEFYGWTSASPYSGLWTATGPLNVCASGSRTSMIELGGGLVLFYENGAFPSGAPVCTTGTGASTRLFGTEMMSPPWPPNNGTGNWGTAPANVYPRGGAAVVALPNGQAVMIGGYDTRAFPAGSQNCSPISSVEAFTVPAMGSYIPPPGFPIGTWIVIGQLNTPRVSPNVTVLSNGTILVAGGYQTCSMAADSNSNQYCSCTNPINTSEIFDPATGQSVSTGSMTFSRAATYPLFGPSNR